MEFVEYLEFIVRISYVFAKDKTNSDIAVVQQGPQNDFEMEQRIVHAVTDLL